MKKGKIVSLFLSITILIPIVTSILGGMVTSIINNCLGEFWGYISLYINGYVVMFIFAILYKKKNNICFSENKLTSKKDDIDYLVIAVILGVGFLLFNGCLESMLPFFYESYANAGKAQLELSLSIETMNRFNSTPYAFLLGCIVGPICEEILYRGVLFNLLERYSNPKWAIVLSSLCFAIMHNTTFAILIFLQYIVVAYIYHKKKNIIYPIIIHMINNTLAHLLIKCGILVNGKNNTLLLIAGAFLLIIGIGALILKNKREEDIDIVEN